MLVRLIESLLGIERRSAPPVDDILLDWTGGSPRAWTSAKPQAALPPASRISAAG